MKNMDRTSWIGVIVCAGLLFAWGWWSTKEATKKALEEQARAAEIAATAPAVEPIPETGEAGKPAGEEAESNPDAVAETSHRIENEFLIINLTNRGAGVKTAELKKHPKEVGGDALIAINETASNAVGSLSSGPGSFDVSTWEMTASSADSATFETLTSEGFHLTKTFSLPSAESDQYEIGLELSIRNDAKTPLILENRYLYSGSAAPLKLNEMSMQIGLYWIDEADDFEYKTVDHYGGRKILGIFGKDEISSDRFQIESLRWAGVNDQFFTTLIKPHTAHPADIWGSRFPVTVEDDPEASTKRRMFAAEAGIGLPKLTMNPGDQQALQYSIYLGPKEFARLKGLGDGADLVMHYDAIPIFGWLLGWAIKPIASGLIIGLVFIKGYVGSYGVAIILITIFIRLLIWPVYAKSARSMKRMSKLTPLMKEIKEKYADDPQKVNEETMKLYRTYNINPLGGCLPMFIQLPVFLSFYRMLWSAAELRHESFLWVDDLSMPDTMFIIPGLDIPFNLLPILMGITSFIQIAITPKTGDKTQQMIFMLMPLIFLVICYNFAAALALYWTTSNAFSILQTWLTNKIPEPELKKRNDSGKKGFFRRMQDQAEAAQKAKGSGSSISAPGKSRTAMPGDQGARHTKGKKKRR
mgnify:CR=1 FL=1